MAACSALLALESHSTLLAEQARQWHTYHSPMAKFQNHITSHPSHSSPNSQSSSEVTLKCYLNDLVKRLEMPTASFGNIVNLVPEGVEGAGAPETLERSTTSGSTANGAGGAG